MFEKVREVTLDTSGYDKFIELCHMESVLNTDIDKLLSTNSYNKAIMLMGENWGVPHKKQWVDYFSKGFECDDNSIRLELLSPIQILGIEHLKKARKNLIELSNVKKRIVESIESREFIRIASRYVPKDIFKENIEVILLVFIPNAGGNQSIIIDVPFLVPYDEHEISRILAHELHHILRSRLEKEYQWKDEYWGIGQTIYWFESEGIADLCNFEETAKIYTDFGYAKPGKINLILENIAYYIKETNDLITDVLKGKKTSEELIQFLSEDVKFHVIGYFLAKTISSTMGDEILGKVVGDPVEFINMYQRACILNKNEKQYGFSDEFLEFLKSGYRE